MPPENKNLFDLLDTWVQRGWLRALDRAFARFLREQQPDSSSWVWLAAALTSHQLGRGHVCLDLGAALADPDATLSLPPEGEEDADMPQKPSALLQNVSGQTWEDELCNSPLVATGAGNTPLVLSDGRLYLRRYWQYTQEVARGILQRLRQPLDVPDLLAGRLDHLFALLRTSREQNKSEVHWQSVAAAVAAWSAFSVISGGPGTGKTTTVVQLLGLLQGLALEEGRRLRIRLAAPTGKAAARLTESIGTALKKLPEDVQDAVPSEVTTLHRLLGSRPDTRHFVHNRRNRLHADLVVVDEASMVDLEMMAALLEALPDKARLILLGDKDQLASVEAGSVLGDLCQNADRPGYHRDTIERIRQHTGYDLHEFEGDGTRLDQHIVVLRKSHRFGEGSGIGTLARAVNAGDTERVADIRQKGFGDIAQVTMQSTDDNVFQHLVLNGNSQAFSGSISSGSTSDGPEPVGYRAYLRLVNNGPRDSLCEDDWLRKVLKTFAKFQLLTALRKGPWGVEGLNAKIAGILYRAGLIRGRQGWYPGRPVIVTRNDYGLGLMNGDIGIALFVAGTEKPEAKKNGDLGSLRVVFPMADGSLKKILPSRLNNVETVYAMTVHKSQGSEFEHATLVLPERMNPVLTRELIYTGITRARNWFTLAGPRLDLLAESVRRRTHRASGLGKLLTADEKAGMKPL